MLAKIFKHLSKHAYSERLWSKYIFLPEFGNFDRWSDSKYLQVSKNFPYRNQGMEM